MSATAPSLLELPDGPFLHQWGELTPDERSAIPDDVRARCYARVNELRPDITASVERARRAQDATDKAEASKVQPLPGFPVSAIWEGFTPSTYLAKSLLAPGDLTVLFGQSGHFKSVIAIDLALSVAAGLPFHGRRTRRAGVLYAAGEGHGGIRKRVRAWLLDRGYTSASQQPWLYVTSAGADLIGQPDQLRATATAATDTLGAPIELVIVDTLAASFGQGDENHARDMQLAIAGARMAAPGAAILLVHHTGQGEQERERGSYALTAAADVRIKATYDETSRLVELAWKKLKDDERPEPAVFNWRKVALEWEDEDGEELTSVVLEAFEGERPPQGPRLTGLGENQETALRILRTLLAKARKNVEDRGDDPVNVRILTEGWKADLKKRGIDHKRFPEVRKKLEDRGLIRFEGPHVMPTEAAP